MAGYGTNAGYKTWLTENGYPEAADEDAIPGARARGSAYIDAVYGWRFSGEPSDGIDQERAWPRDDAEDIYGNVVDGVPNRVILASYEAARLELATPGSLSVLVSANENIKRLKAGSVEIEYATSSAYSAIDGAYPMYTAIEGLLRPLIGASVALPGILVV